MGDAADDVFDAGFLQFAMENAMIDAGCRHCPRCHGSHVDPKTGEDCDRCGGCGWLDQNGNPAEL